MSRYPDAFIREIPKTDLHLHLDGSLRLSTLIEMARKGGVELPSYAEDGMRELVFKDRYADLGEYLAG
ncbi:MAG TPA: adenosine deaminase family protein, partial [Spirochaetales bacterium]|nr:adenosine deaminase family protein [Spirochaetales bacterium]